MVTKTNNRMIDGSAVNVRDFGAVGDGVTDDTAAIQAAIDESLHVYFPEPDVCWRVTAPLQLRGGQKLVGASKSDGESRSSDPSRLVKGIYGDMEVNGTEIFQLGDGVTSSKRAMTFYDLFAYNRNGPVVLARYCTEFGFFGCTLRSRFYHCIDTQQSYLFGFFNCSIGSSGTVNNDGVTITLATRLLDNSNGVMFDNCRMTGGSAGGVATIGRSYNVKFDGCIFESSRYGIYVGSDPSATVGGAVHSFSMQDCQWEQCLEPLTIGDQYASINCRIEGCYFSNAVTSIIPDRDCCVRLGRCKNLTFKNNTFELAANEYAFEFQYNPSGGAYLTLSDCDITRNFYKTVTDGYGWRTTGFVNDDLRSALSQNLIQLPEFQCGDQHQYTSETITCSTGTNPSYIQIAPVETFGGKLKRIELLDVDGSLDGTLYLGQPLNQAEYFSIDLSTASISDRYARVFDDYAKPTISATYLRATQPVLLRVNGGTTSGTFRVRITYDS